MAQQLANSFVVEVEGAPIGPASELASVVVDRSLHVPDFFSLTFKDPGRSVVAVAKLRIGARVIVKVKSDADPAPQRVVEGEITSLELLVEAGGRVVVARGYDLSHRFHRARSTYGYLDVTHADVVARVARRNGLKPGQITPTKAVLEHVGQVDQTDWEFLSALAAEDGFELGVDGDQLHYRAPVTAPAASGTVDLTVDEPLALVVGSSLLRLHAAVRGSGQVAEVEARGWDLATKKPVTSITPVVPSAATIGTTPADVARAIGATGWVVPSTRFANQADVDREAKVAARTVGDALAELEGTARGNPRLRPGVAVQVGQAGPPFDGRYVLTTVRHTMDAVDGFVTHFTVSGAQDRTLLALTGGGAARASGGVLPAVVHDVDDPERSLRVRLSFPWLSADYVSGWCRIVQVGAGASRGAAWLPEIGDEVLVAFEDGDIARPYVLGGVYNGVDHPAEVPRLDASTHAVETRRITSRKGSYVEFEDTPTGRAIAVKVGGAEVVLTEQGTVTVLVKSAGTLQVEGDSVAITARSTLSLSAPSVEVEGSGSLNLKGGTTAVSGTPLRLN